MLAVLTAAMLAMALLGGCASDESDGMLIKSEPETSDEPAVTLNFFGYKVDPDNLRAIETAMHGYMDIHPDTLVVYEGIKGQPFWDALELRAESDMLDDLFNLDHDHMMDLRSQGKLADLSGISTLDNFSDLAKSQFTEKDGSVHYLPISIATYGLYVNEDLLAEHGFSAPTNYSEFAEMCDYFAGQGMAPIIMNNFNSYRSLVVAKALYGIYADENSIERIEEFNDGTADLAESLRPGVEMVADMVERGWIDGAEASETAQTSDDLDLFVQGDRPFMVTGGWASTRVAGKDPDFTYAIYPLPVLDDRSVLVLEMATCIGVNAEGENLDEALEFVEFLSQVDVMWDYCDSQSTYTPLNDDRVPSDPTIAPSTPSMMTGEMVIGSDFNLELPLDSALRECGMSVYGGASVDETMAQLKELLV